MKSKKTSITVLLLLFQLQVFAQADIGYILGKVKDDDNVYSDDWIEALEIQQHTKIMGKFGLDSGYNFFIENCRENKARQTANFICRSPNNEWIVHPNFVVHKATKLLYLETIHFYSCVYGDGMGFVRRAFDAETIRIGHHTNGNVQYYISGDSASFNTGYTRPDCRRPQYLYVRLERSSAGRDSLGKALYNFRRIKTQNIIPNF